MRKYSEHRIIKVVEEVVYVAKIDGIQHRHVISQNVLVETSTRKKKDKETADKVAIFYDELGVI